jgi:hypothetical protein
MRRVVVLLISRAFLLGCEVQQLLHLCPSARPGQQAEMERARAAPLASGGIRRRKGLPPEGGWNPQYQINQWVDGLLSKIYVGLNRFAVVL